VDDKLKRFKELDFEGFRALARDESLSRYEKIGFPDSYRAGHEERIFADIRRKLTNLERPSQTVLDIGPGCADLPLLLIDLCRAQGHRLILVDSQEMLDHLPDAPFITKIAAYYPTGCPELFTEHAGRLDVILTYSVFHYVFAEGNIFDFVDRSLGLLADGGQMLIGDIPNVSKRKRFFSSPAGVRFHQAFMQTDAPPEVRFNNPEPGSVDDAVIAGLMLRCRAAGCDAYPLPQAADLPMANRREDFLICKP